MQLENNLLHISSYKLTYFTPTYFNEHKDNEF